MAGDSNGRINAPRTESDDSFRWEATQFESKIESNAAV